MISRFAPVRGTALLAQCATGFRKGECDCLRQRSRHFHNSRRCSSGIDKVAENKIAEWLHQGGADDMKTNTNNEKKRMEQDAHKTMARSFGFGHDYIHSKILADNNIKPESVQRRLDLDAAWAKLQADIQRAYSDHLTAGKEGTTRTKLSTEAFATSKEAQRLFEKPIEELDRMAKRCNDAIISDTLRFNGRAPVQHSRRFRLQERIQEALRDIENENS